jgi:hypothetical protein
MDKKIQFNFSYSIHRGRSSDSRYQDTSIIETKQKDILSQMAEYTIAEYL